MDRSSIFLVLIFASILLSICTLGVTPSASSSTNIPSETHDLKISQVLTEMETVFERTIILSQSWDRLVLNMTVQNRGDHLENVFLKATANGAPVHATFSAFEEVGLVQAFSYQFEVPQMLLVTLNYSKQTQVQIDIILVLDFGVTLGAPMVDFVIQGAQLIALNLAQPLESQPLPLLQANQYQIQPVKYSFLKKNLILSPALYVQIPEEMLLYCTISVLLCGTKINYLTIDDQTFYPSENDFKIEFNLTKTIPTINQDLFLTMIISPDYASLEGLTQVNVEVTVVGVLQSRSSDPFVNVLGSHPVPVLIMFPFLIITLFGIPYYLVYQEHVSNHDNHLLDPQKQTKL
ncbi:MAG: hypothetical protein ACFFDT_10140 [Candidatus Hodarchaeota archaeon]